MAKTEKTQAKIERVYNIPLRKEFQKTAKYKRSKKAVKAVREFLMKHMKSNDIKIGRHLNMKVWEKGIKNPPHHIKVTASKDAEGVVTAEVVGAPVEKKKEKREKRLSLKEKLMAGPAALQKPKTEEKEEVKETPKIEEKTPEVKKEAPKAEAPKVEEKKPEVKKEEPKTEEKPSNS